MPTSFTHEKSVEIQGKEQNKASLKTRLANAITSAIFGRPMHVSHLPKSAVAGIVIFWYFENGVRQFVMVKNPKEASAQARFVSCLGMGKSKTMSEAASATTNLLLGKVFTRSLDKNLLAADRVCAVPTFNTEDSVFGGHVPVHSIVWAVQITQEQAQMCEPEQHLDVVAVPEFAMMGNEVSDSHKAVYQACLRHIHASNPLVQEFAIDQLEDLLQGQQQVSTKVIH